MHSAAWFILLRINRCYGMWLKLLCDSFLAFFSFSGLLISSSIQGGNVGLSISSPLTIMGTLQWEMQQSAELEYYMTSVKRAQEYSKLNSEDNLESHPDKHDPVLFTATIRFNLDPFKKFPDNELVDDNMYTESASAVQRFDSPNEDRGALVILR